MKCRFTHTLLDTHSHSGWANWYAVAWLEWHLPLYALASVRPVQFSWHLLHDAEQGLTSSHFPNKSLWYAYKWVVLLLVSLSPASGHELTFILYHPQGCLETSVLARVVVTYFYWLQDLGCQLFSPKQYTEMLPDQQLMQRHQGRVPD